MDASTVFWIAVVIIVLLLDAWVLFSVWRSTKPPNTKAVWTVLILLLPFIGVGIWGINGPRGVVEAPTSDKHSKG